MVIFILGYISGYCLYVVDGVLVSGDVLIIGYLMLCYCGL